jgi:AmmeMemoRadiSam system protein B
MAGIVFGCITPHPPLIIPDVGKGGEHAISATIKSMEKLADKMAQQRPQTTLIISPHGKHQTNAMGILTAPSSSGDMKVWGSNEPHETYQNDLDLVELIQQEAKKASIPITSIGKGDYDLDWGVMVPLHFLKRAMKGAALVPLTFCWLSLEKHFAFGKAIRKAAEQSQKRVAIIASGDLSHRLIPSAPAGYDPMGKVFDEKLVKAISFVDSKAVLNFEPDVIERAGECGLRSITILLGVLDGLKVIPEVLSYEGPFGVGYMVASLEVSA